MIANAFISRVALRRDIVESFDRYPFSLPAVRALETLDLHPRMNFFVGENGSGKSTLLEAIAVAMGFTSTPRASNASLMRTPSTFRSRGTFSPTQRGC